LPVRVFFDPAPAGRGRHCGPPIVVGSARGVLPCARICEKGILNQGEAGEAWGATMDQFVFATIRRIDTIARWSGNIFCWMGLALMCVMVYHVFMRYAFNRPTFWAYDMSYMLYGSMFMLGSAYTLYRQGHIRTDFLYRAWSPRTQGILDTIFYIFLFFPAMILFFNSGYEYALRSWQLGERGYMSPWAPPIYPFKTAIPVGIALMIIQGVSELLKSLYAAVRGRWP
jgi:TRAP-type mannitol/chloroaromatic compound transport system permease small subunit